MSDPVPMELVGVRIELPTNTPILLLREQGGQRILPIWIGTGEATAIAFALQGVEPQRPLTHDLMKLVAEALGGTITRVVVTELKGGTFYADLVMAQNGEEVHLSARPSDAIALAARSEADLFAAREVLDEAGVEIRDETQEDQIERFREFLDEVEPEDFGAGTEQ